MKTLKLRNSGTVWYVEKIINTSTNWEKCLGFTMILTKTKYNGKNTHNEITILPPSHPVSYS